MKGKTEENQEVVALLPEGSKLYGILTALRES